MRAALAGVGAVFVLATWSPIVASGAGSPGDYAPMHFMLGTWACSGAALDGTPIKATDTTVMQGAANAGGRMVSHDPQGQSTTTMWWDPAKQIWMLTSDSAKGSSSQTSPGWNGGALVFTGTISVSGAPTAGYRTTITKASDTKRQQVDEINVPGGEWITFDTLSCEKSK